MAGGVVVAVAAAAVTTVALTDEDEPGHVYVASDGALFDERLEPAGRLRLPRGVRVDAASADGLIAFSTEREAAQNWDCCGPDRTVIYVAGGGRDPRRLVDAPAGALDSAPDWSPAGEQLVFIRRRANGGYPPYAHAASVERGLYLHDLGSGDTRRLTGEAYASVDWSPDGRLIAAAREEAIDLLDADSGRVVDRIDTGPAHAVWSPDGTALAVTVGAGPNLGQIAIYDLASRELAPVPGSASITSLPVAWTSHGLFVSLNRRGSRTVLAVSEDGGVLAAGRVCDWQDQARPACAPRGLSLLPDEEDRWPFPRSA